MFASLLASFCAFFVRFGEGNELNSCPFLLPVSVRSAQSRFPFCPAGKKMPLESCETWPATEVRSTRNCQHAGRTYAAETQKRNAFSALNSVGNRASPGPQPPVGWEVPAKSYPGVAYVTFRGF